MGCLLALIRGCGAVGLLMASTSRPNEARWREISRGLAAAGYGRSVAQCRAKWKALKQAFYSERETRRQPGARPPRTPPHYRAMERLWEAAGRPVFGERRLPGERDQAPETTGSHAASCCGAGMAGTRLPLPPQPRVPSAAGGEPSAKNRSCTQLWPPHAGGWDRSPRGCGVSPMPGSSVPGWGFHCPAMWPSRCA